jgi:hypothetical protein
MPLDRKTAGRPLKRLAEIWQHLREYFGGIVSKRQAPITDQAALRHFLDTRASFIAQTSLYGYLRTRAGMLYPQLFDNDEFVVSVNIAKWYVWLSCLSDLAIYTGGLMLQRSNATASEVGALIQSLVDEIISEKSTPDDAGDQFDAQAQQVLARVAGCDWNDVTDDETPFSQSPTAVVRWAPIVENLKELDEDIVRNSVRFRWQEVRRDLRTYLDAAAVLGVTHPQAD